MKFFDHHTHNGFSRCVKEPYTIDQAIASGLARGTITSLGVTNHVHFNSPDQAHLRSSRVHVDDFNARHDCKDGIFALLGVEVDIDHPSGRFVLSKESVDLVDYIIGGPHNQPHRSLAFPDIEDEEIDEYFNSLASILVNGLGRNPIDIWVHPFLQEIEIGGDYFEDKVFSILPDVLQVLKDKGIAMEINTTFHRDKLDTVKIWRPGDSGDPWLRVISMITKVYKKALEYGSIKFSFGSDAHHVDNVGDIGSGLVVARFLGIPKARILDPSGLRRRAR